jgi:hypothetical protein
MSPLNAAICTTTYLERQKCYGPGKKILFKFFLFDLEVKGHYSMWHTALWSCTHIPNKYYLKNNYLTLRSKIKVPRRSLWYATHRLMVMHPHTKYHWPISKDENVIVLQCWEGLWYLTPRSKIFQLYHGGQFYWWKKPLTCRKSYNAVSNTSCLLGIRMHNVGDDYKVHVFFCFLFWLEIHNGHQHRTKF